MGSKPVTGGFGIFGLSSKKFSSFFVERVTLLEWVPIHE
ncbi:hypothetical protein E3G44_003439 [Mycobacteroides abscessus]|nr:hypothetical protein [Mycobacteroides abscessus]